MNKLLLLSLLFIGCHSPAVAVDQKAKYPWDALSVEERTKYEGELDCPNSTALVNDVMQWGGSYTKAAPTQNFPYEVVEQIKVNPKNLNENYRVSYVLVDGKEYSFGAFNMVTKEIYLEWNVVISGNSTVQEVVPLVKGEFFCKVVSE